MSTSDTGEEQGALNDRLDMLADAIRSLKVPGDADTAGLGHQIQLVNGLWWCVTEDVNTDECTDLTRCSNGCVCNDKREEDWR